MNTCSALYCSSASEPYPDILIRSSSAIPLSRSWARARESRARISWRSLSCDGEGRSGVGVVGSVSIERGRDLLSLRAVRRRVFRGGWDAVGFCFLVRIDLSGI